MGPEQTAEKPTPDKSKARQNLNSALKSPGRKGIKKNAINNNSPNKKDTPKKGKNRVRAARTRGASSTATTTTDNTSDEEEAEEDVSHVTPRKKRGKNLEINGHLPEEKIPQQMIVVVRRTKVQKTV